MAFLDALKTAAGNAVSAAGDSAYGAITKAVPGPTPASPPVTTPNVAGPSPISAEALHFSPSGIVAYVKANPVRGVLGLLAVVGVGYLIYKRIR